MPITLDGTNGITTPMYNGSITANAVTPSVNMKNRIINGACVIDQRNAGASVTPANAQYTLDRWQSVASVASKYSIQQNAGSVTPPAGFSNYLGVTSLSAYSVGAGEVFAIFQPIEGFNTADLDFGKATAKTVTLSFWVRSSLTGTFGGSLTNSAYNRSYPFSYTISAANTWEQKSITVVGDTAGTWVGATNGTGLNVQFSLGTGTTLSGTAGAWSGSTLLSVTGATSVVGTNGATFYLTGVQLEVGSTATSFDYRPYGTELALCQRYYENRSSSDVSLIGFCYASNNLNTPVQFLVEKRANPTLLRYGTYTAFVNGGGNTLTYSSFNAATKCVNIGWTGGGISAGQAFSWSSGANPQIAFDAEL